MGSLLSREAESYRLIPRCLYFVSDLILSFQKLSRKSKSLPRWSFKVIPGNFRKIDNEIVEARRDIFLLEKTSPHEKLLF